MWTTLIDHDQREYFLNIGAMLCVIGVLDSPDYAELYMGSPPVRIRVRLTPKEVREQLMERLQEHQQRGSILAGIPTAAMGRS